MAFIKKFLAERLPTDHPVKPNGTDLHLADRRSVDLPGSELEDLPVKREGSPLTAATGSAPGVALCPDEHRRHENSLPRGLGAN